ncbi:MAG: di-trans,poly-cis-decaprenylcistransferase [Christensenellaceae bacterium]|jgi:undecaprenyl diphosphate synthase|nr:di-trans,poly-cis-decaprenylcistransferase [Christensenellaceae bacterium]
MAKTAPASLGLTDALPRHVGIIMDGNGRWAKARSLPRPMGHRAGMERLRGLIQLSSDIGIGALSLYAFSTENWKRPQSEIEALFGLFIEYFNRELDALHEGGVCIRVLGDMEAFPANIGRAISAAQSKTANNEGLKLNIALNYGSRAEVLRAANALIARGQPAAMEDLMAALYTGGLPDLDLVIRTGGEQRLSNFLLLQAAYAELMFVPEYFPDFSDARFVECLRAFGARNRRFGDVE